MITIDNQENVAVETAGETTPQTSSPQVEAPTTEVQTVVEETDQSNQQQVQDVQDDKPNDPREFQIKRLAEENRRLKSERQGSAFDAFRLQTTPGQIDLNSFTDEYGNTNWNAYNAALVTNAQQVAQSKAQETVTELLDEQNARTKHPDLFADPEVEQEIADRWVAAKLRGENPTISEIAERVSKRFVKDVSKAEKRGAERALQEVSVKEQAGLAAPGQTSQGARQLQSDEEYELLSQETRVGNQDAIVARLQNIPWANK